MKNIFIALLLIPLLVFADNLKTIQSSIQSVTVYQQGAQIHRKAYYNVNKGLTIISIENISKLIDPKSIQVNGTGDMIILDSKYKLKYPEPIPVGTIQPTPKLDKELNYLNDSLIKFDYELMSIKLKMGVLTTQKQILAKNGSINGIGKVNDSIPLLKDALNYYYEKMNDINKEVLAFTIKKNEITKSKNRISLRIQTINAFKSNKKQPKANSPTSSIEITISANQTVSGRLEVSYMVKGASWSPLYDIRSSSAKNNIDLTYKAQVYQNTGIDWLDAKLTLSTTNPYSNKTKPKLTPFYVQYYQNYQQADKAIRESKKKALYSNENVEKDTEDEMHAPSTTDLDYYEESKEIVSKLAYNYVHLNEQMISVEYQVNLPYSILSNNEQHLVLVRQESLKSNYKYYTVPKLDINAYLVAELSNLDDLNLIPGIANIFHDGTYVGETTINPSIMSDSLALSLGKDQNIQVKRTLLQKDSKTKVIGDKTIKTYAYLLEIKNHKSVQLNIILQDQIPVTQNSEIEIEIEEMSKGKLNEVTGIVDWNLKLKPKETKTIKLIYTVSTHRGKPTNLALN